MLHPGLIPYRREIHRKLSIPFEWLEGDFFGGDSIFRDEFVAVGVETLLAATDIVSIGSGDREIGIAFFAHSGFVWLRPGLLPG
jgi:hypothetical protein